MHMVWQRDFATLGVFAQLKELKIKIKMYSFHLKNKYTSSI